MRRRETSCAIRALGHPKRVDAPVDSALLHHTICRSSGASHHRSVGSRHLAGQNDPVSRSDRSRTNQSVLSGPILDISVSGRSGHFGSLTVSVQSWPIGVSAWMFAMRS